MLGEKAFDLIRELARVKDIPPAFNEDLIRSVLEEIKFLFEQNQKDVSATAAGEQGLVAGIQLRHTVLERNKRCLLTYLYKRLQRLWRLRWEFGSVLPPEIKNNLCEAEIQWFSNYNHILAKYMASIEGQGELVDFTANTPPPKSHFIEVRCLIDFGEFELEDGTVILLNKNSQHYLLRSQCEHLILQGILEHVTSS